MHNLKKLVTFLAGAALVILPIQVAAQAQQMVNIESQINVRNTTAGGAYQQTTSAKVDDVVAVQVWYHNKENENSGKVANNLRARIQVPSGAGTTHTVTSMVSADNSNSVTDTATITTSLANATLEYIPGSAQWRHNAGTNQSPNFVTQTISDEVVRGGVVLENAQPCFNFEATVTVLLRVKAPVVSIVKQVKVNDGQAKFGVENTAKMGDTLEYVLIIKNQSNTTLRKVRVADGLPPNVGYIAGSTRMVNSNTGTAGQPLQDGITAGGITIDDMSPGSTQYVYLKAKIGQLPCQQAGNHRLRNSASVVAENTNQIFNVAHTNVNVPACVKVQQPPQPQPIPVPQSQPAPILPATGSEIGFMAAAGTGMMGYTLRAYIRSRRSIIERLLDK